MSDLHETKIRIRECKIYDVKNFDNKKVCCYGFFIGCGPSKMVEIFDKGVCVVESISKTSNINSS